MTALSKYAGSDDVPMIVVRRDFSGGANSRQHAAIIKDTQAEVLENFDIGVPGQLSKINGIDLVEDLSNNAGCGLFGFEPDGGTNELLAMHGAVLAGWIGTGTFTNRKTGFTTGLSTNIFRAGESGEGDVVFITNGTDNVFRMNQSHTFQDLGDTNTAPPLTSVMTYYRNRVWALKSNLLYFSDAYPADYSTAFDRTVNAFRVPVGTQRALVGLRDIGLVIVGNDQVWGLNPSFTPGAMDEPQKILDLGCVANKTVCPVGDDVLFLANDGVRGVFRTQADKLQSGQTFPLSYVLKSEYDEINWAYISKACAIYWDNKYFIALPTGTATYNNKVWVFYPAMQAWAVITDWHVASWATMTVSGQQRLYYIDSNDGSVYRAWTTYTNEGTAISGKIDGREEDFGSPMQYKWGGELEIIAALVSGTDTLAISVAIDGQDFQSLGTMTLTEETAPVLPVDLPFYLSDSHVKRQKFHLDSLGKFRTLQVRIQSLTANTDPLIVYGYIVATSLEEYYNE